MQYSVFNIQANTTVAKTKPPKWSRGASRVETKTKTRGQQHWFHDFTKCLLRRQWPKELLNLNRKHNSSAASYISDVCCIDINGKQTRQKSQPESCLFFSMLQYLRTTANIHRQQIWLADRTSKQSIISDSKKCHKICQLWTLSQYKT